MRRDVWLMKVKENVLLTDYLSLSTTSFLPEVLSQLHSSMSFITSFGILFRFPAFLVYFVFNRFVLQPHSYFLLFEGTKSSSFPGKTQQKLFCCKCNFNCWVTDQIKRKMIDISVVRKTNCLFFFFLLKAGAGEIFLNTSKLHLKIAFYWENRNVASVGFMLYTVIITLLLPLSEYKKLDHKSNCYSSVCIH